MTNAGTLQPWIWKWKCLSLPPCPLFMIAAWLETNFFGWPFVSNRSFLRICRVRKTIITVIVVAEEKKEKKKKRRKREREGETQDTNSRVCTVAPHKQLG